VGGDDFPRGGEAGKDRPHGGILLYGQLQDGRLELELGIKGEGICPGFFPIFERRELKRDLDNTPVLST
jgi:hypothetical protein